MKTLIFALTLTATSLAYADSADIVVNGLSWHSHPPVAEGYHWNQLNTGLAVQYQHDMGNFAIVAQAGFMKDSVDLWGPYAIASAQYVVRSGDFSAGVGPAIGAAYRGNHFNGPHQLDPLGGLDVTLRYRDAGVNILAAPAINDQPAIIFTNFTYRFWSGK